MHIPASEKAISDEQAVDRQLFVRPGHVLRTAIDYMRETHKEAGQGIRLRSERKRIIYGSAFLATGREMRSVYGTFKALHNTFKSTSRLHNTSSTNINKQQPGYRVGARKREDSRYNRSKPFQDPF